MTPSPIGPRLAKLRTDAKLTQQRVAELAGLCVSTISNVECGRLDPRNSTVEAIERAIEQSLSPDRVAGIAGATERRADRRKGGG